MPPFKRFAELCARIMAPFELQRTYDALAEAYSAPSRAYHNARHIADCLRQFDAVRDAFIHPDEAELALWFHDAIYDSHAKDNEERCAKWAADFLAAGGAPDVMIARVEALILATRHAETPAESDARLIVDIDLSILGRDEETFDAYDAAIRKEYEWVDDDKYRAGRVAVLRGFLGRGRIYLTDYFFGRYEKMARENLERAIGRLMRIG